MKPHVALIALSIVLGAVLGGCDSRSAPDNRPQVSQHSEKGADGSSPATAGFESPQAAFDGLKDALSKEDWKAAAAAMTPEAQDARIVMLIVHAGLFSAIRGEDQSRDVQAIFKKHGLNSLPEGEREAGDLRDRINDVEDKPALIAELYGWLQENVDEAEVDSPELADGELQNVDVQGNSASGQVVVETAGFESSRPIEFRKIDGRWFVHLSFDEFSTPPSASATNPASKIPDEPVSGALFGRPFEPDQIEVSPLGGPVSTVITMRRAEDGFTQEIKLNLQTEGESLAEKTWDVPAPRKAYQFESVSASAGNLLDPENFLRETYRTGYTLYLEFGQVDDEGQVTGRIYLALPHEQKSEIAGVFKLALPEAPAEPDDEAE